MAIDPKLLEKLRQKRETCELSGGKEKIQKRHEKGLLTARERLEAFFDEGTMQEFGMHVEHSCHNFGMEKKKLPGDGVVCATGFVQGRSVAAVSQDFMVSGGSLGASHAKKICDLMEYAGKCGMPIVAVNDSGGARIQEAVEALSGYAKIFYNNVLYSGVVPQICVIAGPCAGGAVYSPALMDFIIMTRKNSNMFICGPQVIKAATGEQADLEQFATAAAHASVSGNIHFVAEDDAHAMEITKKLLSYLPSNNMSEPPHEIKESFVMAPDPVMNEIVPDSTKSPLDVYQVIDRLVDEGSFFEVQKDWAKSMVIGFARIEGMVVGLVANQPSFKAGCLDIDSSDKGARFIRTCNIYNIPIVNLVDIPGYMPGLAQERGGIIRHGAKMLFAYASASVPKIIVIMRKAYGGAYIAMGSIDMGADVVFAWPTAEIAVMGAQGAVKVLFGKELKTSENPQARQAELEKEYDEKFATPYQAASKGLVTDVIEPSETRSRVALALRQTMNKQVARLPKKHGNIPL